MKFLVLLVNVLAASTALASEITVVHNGSRMTIQIGPASEDVSPITILYSVPSGKMRTSLVQRGELFFSGNMHSESGLIEGSASLQKLGCKPVDYLVVGVFENPLRLTGRLKLVGPAPVFQEGKGKCDTVGYAFTANSELLFTPFTASEK